MIPRKLQMGWLAYKMHMIHFCGCTAREFGYPKSHKAGLCVTYHLVYPLRPVFTPATAYMLHPLPATAWTPVLQVKRRFAASRVPDIPSTDKRNGRQHSCVVPSPGERSVTHRCETGACFADSENDGSTVTSDVQRSQRCHKSSIRYRKEKKRVRHTHSSSVHAAVSSSQKRPEQAPQVTRKTAMGSSGHDQLVNALPNTPAARVCTLLLLLPGCRDGL